MVGSHNFKFLYFFQILLKQETKFKSNFLFPKLLQIVANLTGFLIPGRDEKSFIEQQWYHFRCRQGQFINFSTLLC